MSIYRVRVKLSDSTPSPASVAELATIPTLVQSSSLPNALAVVTALGLTHYALVGVDLTNEKLAVGS
jgi:hypothetical protein